jgi:hypothetical protein
MKAVIQQERIRVVQRFLNGEKPTAICASLGRSKAWLYKLVEIFIADDNSWSESCPSRPLTYTSHTPKEVEEIVQTVCLNLYNHDLFRTNRSFLTKSSWQHWRTSRKKRSLLSNGRTVATGTVRWEVKPSVKALASKKVYLRFPSQEKAPRYPLKKPEINRYHLVRLIRSDQKRNIFSELLPVPPEMKIEYVVATIDVKDQKIIALSGQNPSR